MLIIGLEDLNVRHGGLNRYVDSYVTALRRAGIDTAVIELGSTDGPAPTSPLMRRVGWVARQAWKQRHRTILDVHFALYGLLPMLTAPTSTRRIVHFHGPWAAESGVEGASVWRQRIKAHLEGIVYRRAHVVIALSEAFQQEVIDRYRVDAARVVVIGGGVDTAAFHPVDRVMARDRFSLQPDEQVLVVVRRLVQRMGHETLFEALEQLGTGGRTPTVLLVGSGAERERLEASSRRRELDGQVRFIGALSDEDLVLAYGAANCSIIPSIALEGFGLVALESLACATPVIGSDLGGLGAVLRQLDPSLLVEPGDASSLSRAIARVLDDIAPGPEECRRFALERSWDAIALQHLRLLALPMPRVLYLGHGAQLSGGELALLRQLPSLTSVDPMVVLGEDGPLVGELRQRAIPVVVLNMGENLRATRRVTATLSQLGPRKALELVRYVIALRKEVKELAPDILHTNTLKAALIGGVVGRLTGTPVVWHLRDRIDVDYLPAPAVRLVRLCARLLPSAIVGNSSATLATLSGGRVRMVIPSPLDPEATTGERGSGPLTITMVGRLSPWKGQDLFLQAFALAFPVGPERARIVGEALFGEESYAASLHELANALGIADRVDFLGFRRDVAQLLQTSDIQIVASRIPEPFGNVVLEGMACGTAVIAPNAGGPAEVLSDGVTGILVTPDDADALAEAMRRLGDDAVLRSRLAAAAKLEVGRYRPERLAPKYGELYEAVLHRGDA